MKIMVGIFHPKHVHMFKNLLFKLKKHGHQYIVLMVEKEMTGQLLDSYKIPYIKLGTNQPGILKKILKIVPFTLKTFLYSIKHNPDIFIGQSIPYFAWVSFLLRKPYIVFEDTETSKHLFKIVTPFASAIVTPDSFRSYLGKKHITINGSFELSYLRYNWFTPNPDCLKEIGVNQGEKFIILRFVAWNAHHDVGHSGLTDEIKIKSVKSFEKFGKIFISSECPLPLELEKYRIKINPSSMLSILYYSSLLYGESGSMSAESAYIGTPAIFINNIGLGYTDHQESYGILYNFTESITDQEKSITKGIEILSSNNSKHYWQEKSKQMINQAIDVNSFMVWFIENYPESFKIIKENPTYQEKFR